MYFAEQDAGYGGSRKKMRVADDDGLDKSGIPMVYSGESKS